MLAFLFFFRSLQCIPLAFFYEGLSEGGDPSVLALCRSHLCLLLFVPSFIFFSFVQPLLRSGACRGYSVPISFGLLVASFAPSVAVRNRSACFFLGISPQYCRLEGSFPWKALRGQRCCCFFVLLLCGAR